MRSVRPAKTQITLGIPWASAKTDQSLHAALNVRLRTKASCGRRMGNADLSLRWTLSHICSVAAQSHASVICIQCHCGIHKYRPRGYKNFPYSTQLSTKFQLFIKTKIPTNKGASCFKSLRYCIYHANKC